MYFSSDPLMDDLTYYHNKEKEEVKVSDNTLTAQNITLEGFTQYVVAERYTLVPDNVTQKEKEFLAVSNAFGGEAGELQNIVKKIIRSGTFYDGSDLTEKFIHEAGDALHYLISLITLYGFTPAHIMAQNVAKLEVRKQEQLEKERIYSKTSA